MRFIVAYVEVGSSIILSTLVSQLNGNQTLPKVRLTHIKPGNLYMKPKFLTVANYDTISNLVYDYVVCSMNTPNAKFVKR